MFALPSRFGELGVGNTVNNAKLCFESSVNSTAYLKNSILGNVVFELDAHITSVQAARQLQCKLRSEHNAATFTELIGLFTPIQQRAILRARNSNSSWLSVLPLECNHFNLNSQEFRDTLALRYRKPLLNLPSYCDGCGVTF